MPIVPTPLRSRQLRAPGHSRFSSIPTEQTVSRRQAWSGGIHPAPAGIAPSRNAPKWVKDIFSAQAEVMVDASGRAVSFPACGAPVTLAALKDSIEYDDGDLAGYRIKVQAINDPFATGDPMTGRPGCHAVIQTQRGAFGIYYEYDWDRQASQLGLGYHR